MGPWPPASWMRCGAVSSNRPPGSFSEVAVMTAALSIAEQADAALQRRVLRKVFWRLIPFLGLLYLLNLLDRGNVGFARLTMQADVQMSQSVYDLGIGIFYFGYL